MNDFSTTLRCHADSISRQTYFWLSILGYVVAYFMMTIFLTSYERVPTKNEIAYKSISVAFIKNMGKQKDGERGGFFFKKGYGGHLFFLYTLGLLLALVFLLVESTTSSNRMRAILSMVILLTMICYNIKTRPCYVDKVNRK
jgi:F0F1-type ATP synthase membrane subunit a